MVVTAGDEEVVVTGDVLVHAVQMVNPDVAYRFEADPSLAAETRRAVLERARRHGSLLATAHLHTPFVRVGEAAASSSG